MSLRKVKQNSFENALRSGGWLVGLLIFSALISGCLHFGKYKPKPIEPSKPTLSLPAESEYFSYDAEPSDPIILRTKDYGTFTEQKLRFSDHTAYLYIPKGFTRAPAVVILPITHGSYHSESMAKFLAANGFVGLRFKSRREILIPGNGGDPLSEMERAIKGYAIDIFQGIDWLTTLPVVDKDRIGVVGISFGAIIGMVVAGVDPRIKAGSFILGGGNLAGIIFSSREKSVRRAREKLMGEGELTADEVRREVAKRLRNLDPMTYADRLASSNMLMINAFFDRVIKRRYTKALWKAVGKPPMVQLPTGHYGATVFRLYAKQKTLSHLKRTLGRPAEAVHGDTPSGKG